MFEKMPRSIKNVQEQMLNKCIEKDKKPSQKLSKKAWTSQKMYKKSLGIPQNVQKIRWRQKMFKKTSKKSKNALTYQKMF